MRGKILNVERARLDRVLGNEEVRNIITAVGNGIGEEEDPSKRRYGKVVMMSDADVDGSHIRTLLMTFFFRQMPRLVAEGHLYVAQPPLYMIASKKETGATSRPRPRCKRSWSSAGWTTPGCQPERRDDRVRAAAATGSGSCTTSPARSIRSCGCSAGGTCRCGRSWPRSIRPGDPKLDGLLPLYLVKDGAREHWLYSAEELEAYRQARTPAAAPEADSDWSPRRTAREPQVEPDR